MFFSSLEAVAQVSLGTKIRLGAGDLFATVGGDIVLCLGFCVAQERSGKNAPAFFALSFCVGTLKMLKIGTSFLSLILVETFFALAMNSHTDHYLSQEHVWSWYQNNTFYLACPHSIVVNNCL